MMSSDDIVNLLIDQELGSSLSARPALPRVLGTSREVIKKGKAVWFVDGETGTGEVAVFRSATPPPYEAFPANEALCSLLDVEMGQLWISDASHVRMADI